MTQAEKKAREILSQAMLIELLEEWELTSKINNPDIYTVRGWLMDELETRNPEGFNRWLEGDAKDEELREYMIG